jgi:glycosyltransferase involved in cell wall biosynthesis
VFERAAVRAFDRVITCSDEDAAALPPSGQVTVVPNGVDTAKFRPAPLPAAAKIVMTGALYTGPNVDGATWFCHEVIPLVQASRPDVELDIVGALPTDEVLALGRMGGVTVHADVADVLPFLHASRVAVVPLRLGSGTRLKALEALAAGRPVVGTSIGLEGLDLVDGQHALVADDPQAFATAILRLLGDDQLAAGLVTAGRRLVEDRYSWSHIADRFAEAVIAVGGAERRV